jgi:uncharacterized membrane protein YraQ (UPF0718 family)
MMQKDDNCACGIPLQPAKNRKPLWITLLIGVALLAAWVLIYINLKPFSEWFAYTALHLGKESHLGSAIAFFVLDIPKVFMLLVLIIFGVGILRTFFTPERTRALLVGRREFIGNILAALLGVPTPFCSCSAVPLFLGFVEAGVPMGVTLSFLIASPMVNEVALVLLLGMFGWQVAAIYIATGLVIAIVCGWIIGRMHPERFLEDWVRDVRLGTAANGMAAHLTWHDRIDAGQRAVRDILGKVWPYIIAGIAFGAGIHGYMPMGLMASVMGKGAWWGVPVAVLIGLPLYSNAAGVIPVVQALLEKGAALGTALAFMMSVIGISLPELIILRKVLKLRLIFIFVGVLAAGIIAVGYLFNLIM